MTEFDLKQHLALVNDAILDRGFYIQHMQALPHTDENGREYVTIPYAYTVGRTLHGRPELVVSGTWSQDALESVLARAVERDATDPIKVGTPVEAIIVSDREPPNYPPQPVLPVKVDIWKAQLYTAIACFAEITAIQLLWPDREGRYPTDVKFNPLPHLQWVFR